MTARELGLPQEVDVYHSLYPLEIRNQPGHKSMFFNHPTTAYKAVSTVDGRTYVLYRVEGTPMHTILLNEILVLIMVI